MYFGNRCLYASPQLEEKIRQITSNSDIVLHLLNYCAILFVWDKKQTIFSVF